MKPLPLFAAVIAFWGLTMASTHAQTQSTTSSSTTYIETSKLVGKAVKSSQGEQIGTIKDVVIDRNTGCMAYTVLSTGGGGTQVAGGGKMVAVPWTVYSPSSDVNTYTVTVDRERIYNAPVFDYARVEEYSRPDYINNVYTYYGVSPGVGVGVSGSTTATGATTTTGTTGTATGAGARAGAAASPGASAPAATAAQSPAQSASPGGRASPHATAARTPHGSPAGHMSPGTKGEGTPPSTRGTRGTKGTPPASGHGETGSRSEPQRSTSETERPSSEATNPAERSTGSPHHEKTKHETTSPSEKPPGGE